MDDDSTQVIDDNDLDVTDPTLHNDSSPVGYLRLLKQKNFEENSYPIFKGNNRVGRDASCQVVVVSKTLSKVHCCIEVVGGCHLIYDLDSCNKSRRNKMVLTPNIRYELNSNDFVTLADIKFLYVKSPVEPVADSGSETDSLAESESMLPVNLDNDKISALIPNSDDEDEDDPSSDILQPTQQYDGVHLIGSYNQTRGAVEDSTRKNKGKNTFVDETVLETPPRASFEANVDTQFVPESDSEAEEDLLKLSTKNGRSTDRSMENISLCDQPTQTYGMDFITEASSEAAVNNHSALETLVLPETDLAATQVFNSPTKISDSETAQTQVFSQYSAEKLLPKPSAFRSEDCSDQKQTASFQPTVPYDMVIEETQVIEDIAASSSFGRLEATERSEDPVATSSDSRLSGADQPTQMYIEETQLFDFEAVTAIKVPSSVDKQLMLEKDTSLRESGISNIHFSPNFASTQVMASEADSSFLPSLILDISDRMETEPSSAQDIEKAVSEDPKNTNDLCTQVFQEKDWCSANLETRPTHNTDDLCTQVYGDVDCHSAETARAVAKRFLNTDDICTQVYDSAQLSVLASEKTASLKSADPTGGQRSRLGTNLDGANVCSKNNTDDLCTQVYDSADWYSTGLDVSAAKSHSNTDDICTQVYSHVEMLKIIPERKRGKTSRLKRISPILDINFGDEVFNEDVEPRVNTNHLETQTFECELIKKNLKQGNSTSPESSVSILDSEIVGNKDANITNELETKFSTVSSTKNKGGGRLQILKKGTKDRMEKLLKDITEEISVDSEDQCQSKTKNVDKSEEEKPVDKKSERKKKGQETKSDKLERKDSVVLNNTGYNSEVQSEMYKIENKEQGSSSEPFGRRTSLRPNKGKRTDDEVFLTPSLDGRRKDRKDTKQVEEVETAESKISRRSSDHEITPSTSKSSDNRDSLSSTSAKDSEIIDSSQLSDDDLPSLASLTALNRIPVSADFKTHDLAMVSGTEKAVPSGNEQCKGYDNESVMGRKTDISEEENRNERNKNLGSNTKKGKRKKSQIDFSPEIIYTTDNEKGSEKTNSNIVNVRAVEGKKEETWTNRVGKRQSGRVDGLINAFPDSSTVECNSDTVEKLENVCGQNGKNGHSRNKKTENISGMSDGREKEKTSELVETEIRLEEATTGKNLCKKNKKKKNMTPSNSSNSLESDVLDQAVKTSDASRNKMTDITAEIKTTKSSKKTSKASLGDFATCDAENVNNDVPPKSKLRTSARKACGNHVSQLDKEIYPEMDTPLQLKSVAEKEDLATCKSNLETDAGEEVPTRLVRGKKCRKSLLPDLDDEGMRDDENAGKKSVSNGKSSRTIATDQKDEVASDQTQTKLTSGRKALKKQVSKTENNDEFRHEDISINQKSSKVLAVENADKVMKDSTETFVLSESGKVAGDTAEINDEDSSGMKRATEVKTKRKTCRTMITEIESGVSELTTISEEKVEMETIGSRRGKKNKTKTKPELETEICSDLPEQTSGRKKCQTAEEDTSQKMSAGAAQESSSDIPLQGTGRKRKKDVMEANDGKEDAGPVSKRMRKAVKQHQGGDAGTDELSHQIASEAESNPDSSTGSRRQARSSVVPATESKPKVMFTGVVDANGQKTVKLLGGEMVDSIYDCTHLVTDQVRRTVKFLCGVARGLPIVSPNWLEESRNAGKFLDVSEFLVHDSENEKKFDFKLKSTLQEAVKRPLLLSYSIHVTEGVRPEPKQMKDVIQCAGGKFVPALPSAFDKSLVIVTCEGKDLEACRQLEEVGIPLVSSEFIMSGILQHKLDVDSFRLMTKKTSDSRKRSNQEKQTASAKKKQKR